jgi:phosphoribosylanthranilate isomerase
VTKIKICGVTTLEDAFVCCEAGVDAIGFNFADEAKGRKRYIDPEKAQRIIEQLPPFVASVAVTVNETVERLLEYLRFVDYVQLCGEETPDEAARLGGRSIKVFRAGPDFRAETMQGWPVAACLLDAAVAGAHGGTGKICDWEAARKAVELGAPVMLAGGLTPENVAEAVRTVRPYAVDTAGGVEEAPGKKSHERIRDFVRQTRRAVA